MKVKGLLYWINKMYIQEDLGLITKKEYQEGKKRIIAYYNIDKKLYNQLENDIIEGFIIAPEEI